MILFQFFLNQNENFETFLIKKKKKIFFDFSGFFKKKKILI